MILIKHNKTDQKVVIECMIEEGTATTELAKYDNCNVTYNSGWIVVHSVNDRRNELAVASGHTAIIITV